MRYIDHIVLHCSATKEGQDIDLDTVRKWHLQRGFNDVGYHYLIKLDGKVQIGRTLDTVGAHVKGHNSRSIGICYVGGLDKDGNPKDTRTPEQLNAMKAMIWTLTDKFPEAVVVGHRDLSPDVDGSGTVEEDEWLKDCPCFNVRSWLLGLSK